MADAVQPGRVGFVLTFAPLRGSLTAEELLPYVGAMESALVEPMSQFLAGGAAVIASMGYRPSALDPASLVPMGIRSDGAFAWHACASDYVRDHRIALPGALIAHAVSVDFRSPALRRDRVPEVHEYLADNLVRFTDRKRELWTDGPPPADALLA